MEVNHSKVHLLTTISVFSFNQSRVSSKKGLNKRISGKYFYEYKLWSTQMSVTWRLFTCKIMKKGYKDHTPSISLAALGTLCFVTLIMCQTRFKITKEMSHEMYPPVLRSKDCWFLYTIGNPDRFKCVLRAFVVMSSPILSLISTALLLFGKVESNPYFFIPWLFLTVKGLLLVQTDNIITILRDMSSRTNYAFGFRFEDLKWIIFYSTIFLIDLVESVSFYEVFDLFLVLWNRHPGYNVEPISLEVIKKEIADIMETLSKCSIGNLSSISLGSISESDDTIDLDIKDDDKITDSKRSLKNLTRKLPFGESYADAIFDLENKKNTVVKALPEPFSKGDLLDDQKGIKIKEKDFIIGDIFDAKTPIKS